MGPPTPVLASYSRRGLSSAGRWEVYQAKEALAPVVLDHICNTSRRIQNPTRGFSSSRFAFWDEYGINGD